VEYDRIIAEYLASHRSPTFGLAFAEVTIAMVMVDYLAHVRQYHGTGISSELHRIRLALRPLKDLYASQPAADFGPLKFKAVRQRMIEEGLSRQGVNARMKRIARMFKWAAGEEILPSSIYDAIHLVPGLRRGKTTAPETKPVTPISEEIVEATLPWMSAVVADMVRFQLLVGCRPSEVCGLTPAMIDRRQEVWTARLDQHKTAHHGHDRVLYIGPKAQAILKPYLDSGQHPNLAIFRPSEAVEQRRARDRENRKTPLSCGNRSGKRSGNLRGQRAKRQPSNQYKTASYRRAIHYACDKAFPVPGNLKNEDRKQWRSAHRWSPNRLRHTRATEIRKEFGLEAAQVVLGHSAADVTQVYAERDAAKAIEVARKSG
jgi:integrase